MFQKIITFIKYNNALPVAFVLIFMSTSATLAFSPDVRGAFISSEDVVMSVDNSFILEVDLESFDFGLEIKDVEEDEENYYVSYSYTSIALVDYVWMRVSEEKVLTVSKAVLANHYIQDLGEYVAKELGDTLKSELAYLQKVQAFEKEAGLTQKVVTTEYDGLIGRRLDPKERNFPGYTSLHGEEESAEKKKLSPEEMQAQIAEIMEARERDAERERKAKEKQLAEEARLEAERLERERLAQEEALRNAEDTPATPDEPDTQPDSTPATTTVPSAPSTPTTTPTSTPPVSTSTPPATTTPTTPASSTTPSTPPAEEDTTDSEDSENETPPAAESEQPEPTVEEDEPQPEPEEEEATVVEETEPNSEPEE